MIREDKFRISKRPYAVDLDSLKVTRTQGGRSHWVKINAVWFRRRPGVTVACVGHLWDLLSEACPEASTNDVLAWMNDGRYGGTCEGRWDGESYWGAQRPEEIERHLGLLRPMLENYPEVPPNYDGWWIF